MKQYGVWVIMIGCVLGGGAVAQAELMELQATYDWYLPSGDLWDQGMGAEFKIIEWYENGGGVAFALGMSQWDADDSSQVTQAWNGTIGRSQRWQGDAQYIPIGLSLMVRSETATDPGTTLDIELEMGFRYCMADSGLSLQKQVDTWSGPGSTETTTTSYGADLDSSWVGRVGMNLAWELDYKTDLLTNIGYQFDLSKGQVRVSDILTEDVDLSGFFVQVGLGFHF